MTPARMMKIVGVAAFGSLGALFYAACITPEWLVRFHTGYAIDATDWADVSALCARFGLAVPDDYRRFVETLLSPAATST